MKVNSQALPVYVGSTLSPETLYRAEQLRQKQTAYLEDLRQQTVSQASERLLSELHTPRGVSVRLDGKHLVVDIEQSVRSFRAHKTEDLFLTSRPFVEMLRALKMLQPDVEPVLRYS